jgi:hypothetical protein
MSNSPVERAEEVQQRLAAALASANEAIARGPRVINGAHPNTDTAILHAALVVLHDATFGLLDALRAAREEKETLATCCPHPQSAHRYAPQIGPICDGCRNDPALKRRQYHPFGSDESATVVALKERLEQCERETLEEIDNRDHREDQITAIYHALGGTAEWSSECDLGEEALELAENIERPSREFAELSRENASLKARVAELEKWCDERDTIGAFERMLDSKFPDGNPAVSGATPASAPGSQTPGEAYLQCEYCHTTSPLYGPVGLGEMCRCNGGAYRFVHPAAGVSPEIPTSAPET